MESRDDLGRHLVKRETVNNLISLKVIILLNCYYLNFIFVFLYNLTVEIADLGIIDIIYCQEFNILNTDQCNFLIIL